MPFDSSGVFNRVIAGGWKADAQAGIKIRADRHDDEDDGFATGLSTCLTKDGRTQPTANLPMNGKRFTNVGEPVDPSDSSTKKYVDDRFGAVFNITGIDDAGRINFSGSQSPLATGKPLGLGFTQSDLFFGVKPLDVESVGKKPRFVFNDKGDGMGNDVAFIDETGKLETKGAVIGTGYVAARAATGNVALYLFGAADASRAVLYADAASAGHVNLTVAATQTFVFQNNGQLKVPQHVFSGGAYFGPDGNIGGGSIWTNWGAADAYTAINARIEARAQAWGAAHVANAVTSWRMAGYVEGAMTFNNQNVQNWSGYVLTGFRGNAAGAYILGFRQPQLYTTNQGWVTAFPF